MDQIAILIISALIKYGPEVARQVRALFATKEPTLEDFERVFALADKPYEFYTQPIPLPGALPGAIAPAAGTNPTDP